MDSILIVFYSYTGTSRRVAELMAAQQGWPTGEILEVRPRSGGLGQLRCVYESVFRRRPKIVYKGPDPADFHTVVLISPVWVYSLASPMRAFVKSHLDGLHRVAVLSTMGSSGAAAAAGEVARIVGRRPVLAAGITHEEVESGAGAQRTHEFGDALRPPRRPQPAQGATLAPQAG